MAHAHSDCYAKPVTADADEDGDVIIRCGGFRIVLRPDEAHAFRDRLANALAQSGVILSQQVTA